MKDRDVMVVFTSKSLETMQKEGGSGNWHASRERIMSCRWLVAVRNRHSGWTEGTEEHGSAFLIAPVLGVKPSPSEPGRWVVQFSKYALISLSGTWARVGVRNPVVYTNLERIDVDQRSLEWRESVPTHEQAAEKLPAAVFEAAKTMIARALAIHASAVEITIRF